MRLAKQSPAPDGSDVTAALLFALNWMTMMGPTDLLLRFPTLVSLKMIWLGSLSIFMTIWASPRPSQSHRARIGSTTGDERWGFNWLVAKSSR